MTKVAVIGVGHMGTAIIKGLKLNPENLIIAENPVNPRVTKLSKEIGFDLVNKVENLTDFQPEIIFLTTPAKITLKVAEGLNGLNPDAIIISAAAGVSYSDLKEVLPNNPVVRIIPNIPVAVNAGTIALYSPDDLSQKLNEQIKGFLEQLGDVIQTKEENLSIVGTIGGCGPAFVDIFLDALGDAGVLNGLPRDLANKIAASMIKGSATLAYDTGTAPALLRDQVCSPGGTTIRGVASLEENGFRHAVIEAINKANQN
ncbi:pyrroline-5-carboxylate reductase [Lactobacillus agrestimuris]|uniref:pyrroline-5-carboxylate reductase n=1 Tax=Lactobacillus agrestimuris TaxID=2941328 RepID=UPI002042D7B1|nr:pyrroline-5-carboxylate reductase [Lactobacillus agrestimuris]